MRRLIRLVLRNPRTVVVLWIALLAAAAPFALQLGGALRGSTDAVTGSPSELVSRDINAAFGEGSAFVFPAVLTAESTPVTDPAFAAATETIARALIDSAGVRGVRHFWNTRDSTLLGHDGRSALLLVTPRAATFFDAETDVGRIRAAAASAALSAEWQVKLTGMVPLFHDLDVNSSDDLIRAEKIGIPLVLIVLLVVFGAPLAAGLPLAIALGTSVVALATLFLLSRSMPVSVFAQNAVTMVGLGVGVDYALFLVSRWREELAKGATVRDAVEIATLRAGHMVLVSGLAVCTGFLALFLVRISFLHTLALGGVTVVLTSVLMTVTLLPALLLLLGEKVNWPRHPRRKTSAADSRWGRWAHQAMTHPWRYLVPAVVILGIFIAPTLRLRAWNMGASDISEEMEARQGYELLERNFSRGWMAPIVLLAQPRPEGGALSPENLQALGAVRARLAAEPRIEHATIGGMSEDGRHALLVLVPRGAPESAEAVDLVRELRVSAADPASAAGLDLRVGGMTAAVIDFDAELFGSLKRVVPLVLAITFIVLMIAFRSLVVPLKAIVMNLLSVLAAYGFLVYVFQDGVGADLINLVPPGGLNSFIVLMLFTILFGLSMDYEVFLLGRIKEEYDRTGDNRGSVISGLSQTGGLITSAALIMVVLFGSFGFTRLTATREFGLGLAFAVALDATLIRVVLVPILMGLLGKANWWVPQWLRRS
ncbi:MAG: MMPL family transporter [Gemmatimonadaceae bacterium]|nr:MMPL family transporter [Gemmatimonadaceae bacterium]